MANKSSHKRLQRLVEDEIGKRPKLMYCLRLLQSNPMGDLEGKEEWISRIFLENKESLVESAGRKASEDEDE